MPQFAFSKAMTASEKGYDPLSSWQFRYLPWRAAVKVLLRTTGAAGNVTFTIYSGSETIQQRSLMQVGGTAGVTPSELNTQPIEWIAGAGDVLLVLIDENVAATPTVDGMIIVNPV